MNAPLACIYSVFSATPADRSGYNSIGFLFGANRTRLDSRAGVARSRHRSVANSATPGRRIALGVRLACRTRGSVRSRWARTDTFRMPPSTTGDRRSSSLRHASWAWSLRLWWHLRQPAARGKFVRDEELARFTLLDAALNACGDGVMIARAVDPEYGLRILYANPASGSADRLFDR